MKFLLILLMAVTSFTNAFASGCDHVEFLKSVDGKEKLETLLERSKSLIISKLEDFGIEEQSVKIKAHFPYSLSDKNSSLSVGVSSNSYQVDGSMITLSKIIRDEDCGLEVIIKGGRLINKESGKDFGSLGRVKEFIKLN